VTAHDIAGKEGIPLPGVVEKHTVGTAKIIEGAVVHSGQVTGFHASAVAKFEFRAVCAFLPGELAEHGELPEFIRFNYLPDIIFRDVSQKPVAGYEKIAGIEVAVIFHDQVTSALRAIHAAFRNLPDPVLEEVIEQPDAHIRVSVPEPLVEETAQELSIGLRFHREGRHARIVCLQTGNELKIMESVFHQEMIDFIGMKHRVVVDHGEDIELRAVCFQPSAGIHNQAVHAFSFSGEAVQVVQFPGAVEADTHQKAAFGKKLRPGIIDENGIGLNGIGDDLSRPDVLLLDFEHPLKEIKPHEHGFAALECISRGFRRILMRFPGQRPKSIEAHAVHRGFRISSRRFPVKAIVAEKITIRRSGFYQI
jgi:hypothetical protein